MTMKTNKCKEKHGHKLEGDDTFNLEADQGSSYNDANEQDNDVNKELLPDRLRSKLLAPTGS